MHLRQYKPYRVLPVNVDASLLDSLAELIEFGDNPVLDIDSLNSIEEMLDNGQAEYLRQVMLLAENAGCEAVQFI